MNIIFIKETTSTADCGFKYSSITMTFISVLFLLWVLTASSAAARLRSFHLEKSKMNLIEAREKCTSKYTDLVTVYDQQDNMELTKMLKETCAWIGVYMCKWSEGDPATFNLLGSNSIGKNNCAAAIPDGNWTSLQCNTTKYFMCSKKVDGKTSYNYTLIPQNKTWFEAQQFCRESHTDLVSIRDETQNNQVMEAGKESESSFWIGLRGVDMEWFDGGQSNYSNYMKLSSKPPTKCFTYTSYTGSWNTAIINNCSVLCSKILIHVSKYKMSWEKALDYCNSSGLLQIQSEKDQRVTECELRRRNISGPVWVGLRKSRLFGFWIWSNGLHVGHWTNWKGGNQPEHQLSHHCGAMEMQLNGEFKWIDKDCRSEFTVLCEMQ